MVKLNKEVAHLLGTFIFQNMTLVQIVTVVWNQKKNHLRILYQILFGFALLKFTISIQ